MAFDRAENILRSFEKLEIMKLFVFFPQQIIGAIRKSTKQKDSLKSTPKL